MIHLAAKDHEIRVKELQILVHVMHKDGKRSTSVDGRYVADERMTLVKHGIDESVNHPTIEEYLHNVVLSSTIDGRRWKERR